jgi:hypothetical protein
MGVRYSDAFNIVKDDVGKSVYKKHYKDLTEWWIYREKKSRFVDARGKQLKQGETYLYCVIVCENDYIRQQNEKFIAVEGVKFTEEGLDDYLRKTGRG